MYAQQPTSARCRIVPYIQVLVGGDGVHIWGGLGVSKERVSKYG